MQWLSCNNGSDQESIPCKVSICHLSIFAYLILWATVHDWKLSRIHLGGEDPVVFLCCPSPVSTPQALNGSQRGSDPCVDVPSWQQAAQSIEYWALTWANSMRCIPKLICYSITWKIRYLCGIRTTINYCTMSKKVVSQFVQSMRHVEEFVRSYISIKTWTVQVNLLIRDWFMTTSVHALMDEWRSNLYPWITPA